MNEVSRSDGIPDELFEILKDDAVKSAALNMPTNLENSAMPMELENVSFHSSSEDRQCQKNPFKLLYNCTHFTC